MNEQLIGKVVTLRDPYQGYTSGVITGNWNTYRYEVRLGSGKLIWLYDDEFTVEG